jgi:hypothetical protein
MLILLIKNAQKIYSIFAYYNIFRIIVNVVRNPLSEKRLKKCLVLNVNL